MRILGGVSQLYKRSRYNFCHEYDHGRCLVIYNSKSGAILQYADDELRSIKIIMENPDDYRDSEFFAPLLKNGIIVSEDFDEYAQILSRQYQKKTREDELHLTILPTFSCNFNCHYCFEINKDHVFMSRAVYDDIYRYLDQRIKTGAKLFLLWFGGEPLLAKGDIITFMGRVTELKHRKDLALSSSLVTNGYSLTLENFTDLQKAGINSFQVTFDGDRSSHDDLRRTKNNQGTFQVILDNLLEIKESKMEGFTLVIRCNMTKGNHEGIKRFIDSYLPLFRGDERFEFVVKPVLEYNPGNQGSVGYIGYEEVFADQYRILAREPFGPSFLMKALAPRSAWCNVDVDSSHIIVPDGRIYACESMLTQDEGVIGRLQPSPTGESVDVEYNGNFAAWRRPLDEELDQKCRRCKLLPICVGGCKRFKKALKRPTCYLNEELIYNILGYLVEKKEGGGLS